MRALQIVILTLIVAYPDDVLSERRGRRTNGDRKVDNGPCGKRFLRQINGKCYYMANKKMNWFGAQNNCLRKGLNLADLSTPDEFNAIIKFLRTKGNMEDFWFGGNDLQAESRFTYISNGRPVRYLGGIDKIEKTLRSNLDDCLEIRLREDSSTVTDDNCQEQQYFICQQNELKCAQPVIDETTGVHHSHEHLHHFHHDAAKAEIPEEGSQESLESDSRPADNSNSTEIGESPESGQIDEGTETEDAEGEDTGEAEDADADADANADAATQTDAPGASLAGEEATATTAAPAEEGGEAKAAEETTAAAAAAEAPTEEGVAARAPKAKASDEDEDEAGNAEQTTSNFDETEMNDASPVSVDIGAQSPTSSPEEATENPAELAGEESAEKGQQLD
ncbi:hypothetical protein ACLKA6_015617 [Drosophila palustris]